MDLERRKRQAEAYRLQVLGASEGALRWTIYGLLVTTTLHYTWRPFRNGTLAGKGFIVSGFTIFGLVTWADHYLLSYEREERAQGAELRRLAQQELTNTGRVASEGEIKLWLKARADRDRDKAAGFDKPTSQA